MVEHRWHVALTSSLAPTMHGPSAPQWIVLAAKPLSKNKLGLDGLRSLTVRLPSSFTAAGSLIPRVGTRWSPDSIAENSAEVYVVDTAPATLSTVHLALEERCLEYTQDDQHMNGMPEETELPSLPVRSAPLESNSTTFDSGIHGQIGRLRPVIRDCLGSWRILRTDDALAIPIQYGSKGKALKAMVTICEPVNQGIVGASTRIIVSSGGHSTDLVHNNYNSPVVNLAEPAHGSEAEGTSDDQFLSATESTSQDSTEAEPFASAASSPGSVTQSDCSLDNIISLSPPILHPIEELTKQRTNDWPPMTSSDLSPNLAFSHREISGAPACGRVQSQSFRALTLTRALPDTMLHPRPASEDDEEARVFVELDSLIKLRCFSGDWVLLEEADHQEVDIGCLSDDDGMIDGKGLDGRAVRVYGLPHGLSPPAQANGPRGIGRVNRRFGKHHAHHLLPQAYLSPFLLANHRSPSVIRLSSMSHFVSLPSETLSSFSPANSSNPDVHGPPIANEVTLLKISSPISLDRTSQSSLLLALKKHFEGKQRLVKRGDLVAVVMDTYLGRLVSSGHMNGEDEQGTEELMESLVSTSYISDSHVSWRKAGIAWFEIGDIKVSLPDGDRDVALKAWGGTVVIDPSITRMIQAGNIQRKLPRTEEVLWEDYVATKSASTSALYLKAVQWPPSMGIEDHVSPLRQRLKDIISAAISPPALHVKMPSLAVLLRSEQRGVGKVTIATQACSDMGMHSFQLDAFDVVTGNGQGGGDLRTEALLRARFERAMTCGPENCALIIRHIEAFSADRITSTFVDIMMYSRVIIATTSNVDQVPPALRGMFTHGLEVSVPEETERLRLLQQLVATRGGLLASDVDLSTVAKKTAALVAADLVDVVNRAIEARSLRIERTLSSVNMSQRRNARSTIRDLVVAGGEFSSCLMKQDFERAVEAARRNFSDSIGAPRIPTVGWDDVGGLVNVKDAVLETIQLPLEHPELFARGIKKRSGILFYGPPGTGKTLLAKAIATEFSLNFFSVKGPELLNMYIGESEANVRRVFQRARDARPCVVFFDELDSVAPRRGNQGDSGGVMDRIVSQLLAELDGMNDVGVSTAGVFVIGATNRPDLLDPALLRPGRFDKTLYLGLPDTHEKQLRILEALTRRYVPSNAGCDAWGLNICQICTASRIVIAPNC